MQTDPFKEYLKQQEPDKKYKGYAWQTAIGLQAVDGLKPSEYLVDAAIQNIEGKITLDEVKNLLDSYYEEKPQKNHDRTEEADKVSIRIAKILSEHAFSFTPNEYISIHRKLFTGIYDHAGKIRDYNITKKEWVLNGATVIYGSASELRKTLEYDFMKEKHYSYKGLSMDEIIHHLAVFFIKYLRTLGFDATNDIFAENAWYFRNALVRANYNDLKHEIHETTEYLELFLRNLLLDEKNLLQNRLMHVDYKEMLVREPKIEYKTSEANIENRKVNIQLEKVNIGMFGEKISGISKKTIQHMEQLCDSFDENEIFGRSRVEEVTGLKNTRASLFLKELLERNIIQKVTGHGKGKYTFFIKE